jgi:hypothetical protein
MNEPHYYVAKYVPDLMKWEPRNIGVLIWTPYGVAGRFLGEKENRLGEVDGRKIPAFVTSADAYREWIYYWRSQLEKETVSVVGRNQAAHKTMSNFLEIIAENSTHNFLLQPGGQLLDPINQEELPNLLEYLFEWLVNVDENIGSKTLDVVCRELLNQSGLIKSKFFRKDYQVECSIPGKHLERFSFDYAYQNGSLQRLYQKMSFSPLPSVLERSTQSTARMFEKAIEAEKITPENGCVLVYTSPDIDKKSDYIAHIKESVALLESVTRVIDLSHKQVALQEFEAVGKLHK